MEFFKTIVLTKNIRIILWSATGILLAFLIFHAGLVAGAHRGLRSHGGGYGFRPPFGAPGFMLPDGFLPPGHGAVGIIATVALPTLTITQPNGDSKTVFLATTTRIDGPRSTSASALVPGKRVIIFGDPDEVVEGINAKVIHILP